MALPNPLGGWIDTTFSRLPLDIGPWPRRESSSSRIIFSRFLNAPSARFSSDSVDAMYASVQSRERACRRRVWRQQFLANPVNHGSLYSLILVRRGDGRHHV